MNFLKTVIAGGAGVLVSRHLLHLQGLQAFLAFMAVFLPVSLVLGYFINKRAGSDLEGSELE
ncbi:hypothetical protein [Desulfotalea psychrophila]|uniref:hypothetical protein n=1 Tax=Desulfotalea psychrophila TaxID=84980 RepID=UPI0002E6DE19|nr:hypothetical protein [Desulfotalea psychrophila]